MSREFLSAPNLNEVLVMTTLRSSFYDDEIEFLKQALYEPLDSVNLEIEDDNSIDEFVLKFADMIKFLRDSEDLSETSEE